MHARVEREKEREREREREIERESCSCQSSQASLPALPAAKAPSSPSCQMAAGGKAPIGLFGKHELEQMDKVENSELHKVEKSLQKLWTTKDIVWSEKLNQLWECVEIKKAAVQNPLKMGESYFKFSEVKPKLEEIKSGRFKSYKVAVGILTVLAAWSFMQFGQDAVIPMVGISLLSSILIELQILQEIGLKTMESFEVLRFIFSKTGHIYI